MIDDIKEILDNKKVMEMASRQLCKMRGVDPDAISSVSGREIDFAAREITTMLQVLGAVGIAVEAAEEEQDNQPK